MQGTGNARDYEKLATFRFQYTSVKIIATRAASMDSRVVATERLCRAIAAIPKDPDFSLATPRMVFAKETSTAVTGRKSEC